MTVFCSPRAAMYWSVAAVRALTKSSSTGERIAFARRREVSERRYSLARAASRGSVDAITVACVFERRSKRKTQGLKRSSEAVSIERDIQSGVGGLSHLV